MPICPVTKKCEFIVTKKTLTLFHRLFCAALAQDAKILTQDFSLAYIMPVKFYPDPLRFARVIRKKLILRKYIFRCHAFA